MSLPAPTLVKRTAVRKLLDSYAMLAVAVGLFVLCSVTVPNFAADRNMIGLSVAVSMVGIVACTMMFCLAAGDVDLSVGTLVPCAGVIVAVVLKSTGNLGIAILASLVFGVAVGLVNGIAVARLKIGALIATLATMQISKSFGLVISGGKAVGSRMTALTTSEVRSGLLSTLASFDACRCRSGSLLPAWFCSRSSCRRPSLGGIL